MSGETSNLFLAPNAAGMVVTLVGPHPAFLCELCNPDTHLEWVERLRADLRHNPTPIMLPAPLVVSDPHAPPPARKPGEPIVVCDGCMVRARALPAAT